MSGMFMKMVNMVNLQNVFSNIHTHDYPVHISFVNFVFFFTNEQICVVVILQCPCSRGTYFSSLPGYHIC
jgi:hypothetical protein